VAAGVADKCEIQLAYAIGVAEPVSIMVDTHGTGKLSEQSIITIIRELFDLTPLGIIRTLKLRRPIYLKTAAYGHFGRNDEGFTWEELDRVNEIKRVARHHGHHPTTSHKIIKSPARHERTQWTPRRVNGNGT